MENMNLLMENSVSHTQRERESAWECLDIAKSMLNLACVKRSQNRWHFLHSTPCSPAANWHPLPFNQHNLKLLRKAFTRNLLLNWKWAKTLFHHPNVPEMCKLSSRRPRLRVALPLCCLHVPPFFNHFRWPHQFLFCCLSYTQCFEKLISKVIHTICNKCSLWNWERKRKKSEHCSGFVFVATKFYVNFWFIEKVLR